MSEFSITKKVITPKALAKDRGISILEFNERILGIARLTETPLLEKMKYISILKSNIIEFLSTRMPSVDDQFYKIYADKIKNLFHDMDYVTQYAVNMINDDIHFMDEQGFSITDFENDETIIFDQNKIYDAAYIDGKWKIREHTEYLSGDKHFYFQLIESTAVPYMHSGNTQKNEVDSLEKMTDSSNSKPAYCAIIGAYKYSPIINRNELEEVFKGMNISEVFYVDEDLICIDYNIKFIKSMNEYIDHLCYSSKVAFPYTMTRDQLLDYVKHKDMMIRNPYQPYVYVTEFIRAVCNSPEFHNIFITLYRTADNSVIEKALIDAAKAKKSVYVYVEITARGNEDKNIQMVKRLRDNGVHVNTYFIGYKVHAKLFLAIGNHCTMAHIGTGNYNEDTARFYTDTHVLTSNRETCAAILNVFQMLFSRNDNFNLKKSNSIFVSPFNSRSEIIDAIEAEAKKGENGRIYIKCNSLCDMYINRAISHAAKKKVDIKLIVRTGLSILPTDIIHIRSKIGQYLEHDRIYIIGDNVYIASADLMMRNLNKRIECVYKIHDDEIRNRLIYVFMQMWNGHIFEYDPNTLTWDYK